MFARVCRRFLYTLELFRQKANWLPHLFGGGGGFIDPKTQFLTIRDAIQSRISLHVCPFSTLYSYIHTGNGLFCVKNFPSFRICRRGRHRYIVQQATPFISWGISKLQNLLLRLRVYFESSFRNSRRIFIDHIEFLLISVILILDCHLIGSNHAQNEPILFKKVIFYETYAIMVWVSSNKCLFLPGMLHYPLSSVSTGISCHFPCLEIMYAPCFSLVFYAVFLLQGKESCPYAHAIANVNSFCIKSSN